MPHTKLTDNYERWEIQKMIDEQVATKLQTYDTTLKKEIEVEFKLQLQQYKTALAIGRWLAVTVAVLVVGTLYQLFISIANTVGLK